MILTKMLWFETWIELMWIQAHIEYKKNKKGFLSDVMNKSQ